MQGAIARVCVVVAAAILNHPLLFPQENTTLPEQDEELIARMREHEERMVEEQARLERELSKQEETSPEKGYTWSFWSTVSFIVFLIVEMCRLGLTDAEIRTSEEEDLFLQSGQISPRAMVLDKEVLSNFCDKCSCTLAHDNWKVREFVEGLTDDLLDSLRIVCNKETDMEVGDFIGVGSMFESWKVCKPLICDVLVPILPPYPYSFQFHLWCSSSSDIPPNLQGCGKIKVIKLGESEESCACSSANLGEDVLCLLHGKNETMDNGPNELLQGVTRDKPFLTKDKVMKWFQISVTKAWGRISHKYDFEVSFRSLDAAGALKIRFRSGKVIVLNIIPVVQLEDTDTYYVSHFPLGLQSCEDPHWSLSFAVYERNLLQHFSKRLPKDSCHFHCLQIVTFLHRKQTGLTGKSGLSSYHLKTAVLHVLLSKKPSAWVAESTDQRLRDVLSFLHGSLQEKRLYHALVGNKKVPEEVCVPQIFRKAEPINLFRPLVLDTALYAATVRHFQEMLRNAHVLLQEYTPYLSNGGVHQSLNDHL